ncbi:MAG: hypothetical protein G01um10145_585 [Microgenomates group bacterium Gr01-1014_5]|nr:MAG: hypothetical protein G01um10145_585 [Microgenomates group bacterium Gr01-1014_5]
MLPERVTAERYKKAERENTYWGKFRNSTPRDHMSRYIFAANLIQGSPEMVIDAASGSGWGTHYLATHTDAGRVIGLDCNEDALREARNEFTPNPRVHFYKIDLADLQDTQTIEPADWVVSFETLEHVSCEQNLVFLRNLARLHTGEGQLVISTPNAPLFSPYAERENSPWYKYHQKEYGLDQFLEVLDKGGWEIKNIYGQRFVDREKYLKVANLTFPFRILAKHLGLPWNHRLYRLPIMFLIAYYCFNADSQVKPIVSGCQKEPVFLLAVCNKK